MQFFSQSNQSDSLENDNDNSIPTMVNRCNLFCDSSKLEEDNKISDSTPSLGFTRGLILCQTASKAQENTLGVLGKSVDETEASFIVQLDDV